MEMPQLSGQPSPLFGPDGNIFLKVWANSLSFSLWPMTRPFAGHYWDRSGSTLLTPTQQVFIHMATQLPGPPLLQAQPSRLSASPQMLQSPQHICNSLLEPLHQVHACLAPGSPAAPRCLTSSMQKGRIRMRKAQDHLPQPAANTLPNKAHGAAAPLGSLLQSCLSACEPPACTGAGV